MKKLTLTMLAMSAAYSGFAQADIQLNGFASIRATTVDSDGGGLGFGGLTADGEMTFKDESLFALQARANLGDGLSATIQLMAEGVNEFEAEAKWAYLTYELNDQHSVSAGRFANPIFFQSQYEKVGFAHNYSRLPKAVYIGFDFSTIEGIALDSSFLLGDYSLDTKLLYGNWQGTTYIASANADLGFGIKNLVSLNATLSGDWWKVFAGGFTSEIEGGAFNQFVLAAAQGGVDAAIAGGAAQSEVAAFQQQIGIDGASGDYMFAGFGIDYNNFIIDYEYVEYGIEDSADGISDGYLFSVGYRFDNMVVTVHTEDYNQTEDYAKFNNITNPTLNATASGVHAIFQERLFDANGVTLRYDFHPSAALKVDYLSGTDSTSAVGDYSIWSVGVDMVF